MTDKIISAKNVELKFGRGSEEVVALKNISLEVGAGEFVSFIGPSGCGKTTFLRTVAALEKPTSGHILVNGVSPDEARTNRAYGYVFQSSEIYDGLASTYDYGPNGIELKNNIKNYWWKSMVNMRENIVGLDSAIFMHPKTWIASGHV